MRVTESMDRADAIRAVRQEGELTAIRAVAKAITPLVDTIEIAGMARHRERLREALEIAERSLSEPATVYGADLQRCWETLAEAIVRGQQQLEQERRSDLGALVRGLTALRQIVHPTHAV